MFIVTGDESSCETTFNEDCIKKVTVTIKGKCFEQRRPFHILYDSSGQQRSKLRFFSDLSVFTHLQDKWMATKSCTNEAKPKSNTKTVIVSGDKVFMMLTTVYLSVPVNSR